MRRRTFSNPARERLIKAAGDVFAVKGYEATTVREICARAGANVSAVKYYFGDKLELYLEVFRTAAAGHGSVLAAFEENASKEQILRRVIRAMLHRMCDEKPPNIQFRLMAQEMAKPTPAVGRIVREAVRPIHDLLRGLIAEILGTSADDEQTRLCTNSVVGQCSLYVHSRVVLRHLWPTLHLTPAQLDRIADHVADVSLAHFASLARREASRAKAGSIVSETREKKAAVPRKAQGVGTAGGGI